jgi:hypothetical protein
MSLRASGLGSDDWNGRLIVSASTLFVGAGVLVLL